MCPRPDCLGLSLTTLSLSDQSWQCSHSRSIPHPTTTILVPTAGGEGKKLYPARATGLVMKMVSFNCPKSGLVQQLPDGGGQTKVSWQLDQPNVVDLRSRENLVSVHPLFFATVHSLHSATPSGSFLVFCSQL